MLELLSQLIGMLQDLFGGIFFPSSPEYKKKKELRRLTNELRKISPPLYRSDKMLQPAFASLIYQLYHYAQPIKTILEKTVCSADIRQAKKYQSLFFEELFHKNQKESWQLCSFNERNTILAEYKKYEDAEKKTQDQTKEFKELMQVFQSEGGKKRETALLNLFFLFDLCSFDYGELLSHFNNTIQLKARQEEVSPVKFEAAFGEALFQDLLDFQFIIKHVLIDTVLIDDVIFLAKNMPDFEESSLEKITKTLQAIEIVLSKHIGRSTIPIILKLIKNDPAFEEQASMAVQQPLQEYVSRLNETFQADTKRLLKIQKEYSITALIEKCFAKYELKQLEGYNDTINDVLQNFSTNSFDWIRPVQLLKAFTSFYFEARYKIFLKALLVEGFFVNKQIELKYSSVLQTCEIMQSKINAFEDLFKPDGQCSIQQLKQYITEIEQGKDLKKQISRIVEIANMQAKTLVQTGGKAYLDLYTFIEQLFDDMKKMGMPDLITNIKSLISANKNRESFMYLEQDRHIFAQFLEIMKNYAVLGIIEQPAAEQAAAGKKSAK